MSTEERARAKLVKARILLHQVSPFFGFLAMKLKLEPKPLQKWSMTVDGEHIFYRPELVVEKPIPELVFDIAHETGHCILRHLTRRGERDPKRWNIASDFAVNSIIIKYVVETFRHSERKRRLRTRTEDYITVPDDILYNPAFNNLTAEEIYELIRIPPGKCIICPKCRTICDVEKLGDPDAPIRIVGVQVLWRGDEGEGVATVVFECTNCGFRWEEHFIVKKNGGGGSGCPIPIPIPPDVNVREKQCRADGHLEPKDEAKAKELSEKWRQAVWQAIQHCRQRGELPAGLLELIQETYKPKLNWRQLLQVFVEQSFAKIMDYSWIPPSKKCYSWWHGENGIILPGIKRESLGDIVVMIDTSGSISSRELRQFFGELEAIRDSYPAVVHVIQHDAAVQKYDVYDVDEELPRVFKAKGRGGTNHKPAFEFIKERNIRPVCIICLTDSYTVWPEERPPAPVLVITTPDHGRLPEWPHVHIRLPRIGD